MTAAAPLLEIDRLSVRFGDATVVDDVSFSIAAGEKFALVGESGSGKSITALAILGLLPRGLSASGSILVDGQQVIGATEAELTTLRGAKVAMVSQDPSRALDPLARVGRQVAEPLQRHQQRRGVDLRTDTRIALAEVALTDLDRIIHSYPHELSGGQRQRIALAMALACRPGILLADEPTTALDVTVQAEVVDLLKKLCRQRRMTTLFISHDIALVSGVVDSVLVMKDGLIVERGPVAEVVGNPQHSYTQGLVRAATMLEGALRTGSIR